MILSSFGFRRKVDFVLYVYDKIDIFQELNFPILSRLGFMRNSFPLPHEIGDSTLVLVLLVWETQKGQQRAPVQDT